jgi:hypothetical protein
MSAAAEQTHRYQCVCRHEFQVFGSGRHRRYFDVADIALTRPVIARVCPACQRTLPGKNPV